MASEENFTSIELSDEVIKRLDQLLTPGVTYDELISSLLDKIEEEWGGLPRGK